MSDDRCSRCEHTGNRDCPECHGKLYLTRVSTEPTVIPLLLVCLECELPVQAGDGPGGVAFHDCSWVSEVRAAALPAAPAPEPGIQSLLDRVTQSLARRVDDFNARDLADVLKSLADLTAAQEKRHGQGSEGGTGDLLAFVATR